METYPNREQFERQLAFMQEHLHEAIMGLADRERNGGYSSEWRSHVARLRAEIRDYQSKHSAKFA